MSKEISKEKTNSLLKCPFCGGEAEITINKTGQGQTSVVRCVKCTCRKTLLKYPFYKSDIYEDAVKDWNTRKPMQNIVERLEAEKSNLTTWAEDMAFKIGIEKAIEIVKEEGGAIV